MTLVFLSLTFILSFATFSDAFYCKVFSQSSISIQLKSSCSHGSWSPSMCLVNNQKKSLLKKSTAGPKLTSATTTRTKKPFASASENGAKKGKPGSQRGSETHKKDASHKAPISSESSKEISSESNYPELAQKEDGESNSNLESLLVDEGFRTALKDFRKANAPKKLIRAVANYSESGMLDQNMTVHAFRTLQRMSRFS